MSVFEGISLQFVLYVLASKYCKIINFGCGKWEVVFDSFELRHSSKIISDVSVWQLYEDNASSQVLMYNGRCQRPEWQNDCERQDVGGYLETGLVATAPNVQPHSDSCRGVCEIYVFGFGLYLVHIGFFKCTWFVM